MFALLKLFEEYITQSFIIYDEELLKTESQAALLGVKKVMRKPCNRKTKFKTLFGDIWNRQIQVRIIGIENKIRQKSITRILLSISSIQQIPYFMKDLMEWVGSLASFREEPQIVESLTSF